MKYSYVLVLLYLVIGVSCCPSPKTSGVRLAPEIEAYRKDLRYSVDRISDLAAQLDLLQEEVGKLKGQQPAETKIGRKCLADLLNIFLRKEESLMKSMSEFNDELR